MPKVSVIIPVFNTEKYLTKCLDSVCNQTLGDIEIICIDDCSTDNSLNILKDYASKDKRIKLIEFKENKGAAVARNTGITEAQGEYIGFVDSDDYVDLNFYEKLYRTAGNTEAEVVKSNLSYENNPTISKHSVYVNLEAVKASKFNLIHIPTTIIKKDFIIKNNILFPENLCCAEDSVFELKIGALCNKISIDREIFYHYRYNNVSLNNTETYNINKLRSHIMAMSLMIDFFNQINLSKEEYIDILYPRFTSFKDICYQKLAKENKIFFDDEVHGLEKKIKFINEMRNFEKFKLVQAIRKKMKENFNAK